MTFGDQSENLIGIGQIGARYGISMLAYGASYATPTVDGTALIIQTVESVSIKTATLIHAITAVIRTNGNESFT